MKNWSHILPFKFFFLFLFLLLGIRLTINYFFPLKSVYNENTSELIGQIKSLKIEGDLITLKIHSKEDIVGFYYLQTEEEKNFYEEMLMEGQQVHIRGVFTRPKKNTLPNGFNYQNYLKSQKIFYTVTVSKIEFLKEATFLYKLKNKIIKYLKQLPLQNYYEAFILGDTSHLDKDTLSKNGISHLFSISGMHISFLIMILGFILPKNKFSFGTVFIFFSFYAFLTNYPISILRSLSSYYLTYFNQKYNIGLTHRWCLILIGLVFLIVNPYLIENVSFLFSFYISFCLSFIKISKNYFASLIKTSAVSLLASIPILGYYFYQVNLFSFFFNLLVIPFVSFLLFPLCLLTTIFSSLNFLFSFLVQVFEKMNNFFASCNVGMVLLPKISKGYYFVLAIVICLFLYQKKSRVLTGFLLILLLLILKITPYLDSSFHIYFLDVGQGDATLLVFPHQKEVILIDTGGKIDYSTDSWQVRDKNTLTDNLITFMHSLGISKITYLILTHGDYDHMGEAISLVDNIKVEKVSFNCGSFNDLENKLVQVLKLKKIKYESCSNEIKTDKYKFQFLNTTLYDNENDNSSVIYLNDNNYKFLFMGDASVKREKDLLKKYNLNYIDFLKVGHHGSDTSSSKEFMDFINPKYSIISVGKNNRYGHPKDSVLKILSSSKIYRTDLDGSIEIILNKKDYQIKTYQP